jgi:thiamine-monophosphate kinase
VGLGRLLLERRIASSAIDLSDGLSMDLSRLVDASHVGARLLAPAIPIHDAARALAPLLDADPLDLALHGGEDYELLFTVPPSRESLLAELACRDPVCSALFIGRITTRPRGARTVILADASGRGRPLPAGGFDHFLAR